MITYLCDTNIISEIMKKKPDQAVLDWFRKQSEIALSSVTIEEIQYGLRRKWLLEKEAWFRRFIHGPVVILEVDSADAIWAGEKRGELSARGIATTQADALIAAAAWKHGYVLATRNIRDFEHFGIAVLNPFSP